MRSMMTTQNRFILKDFLVIEMSIKMSIHSYSQKANRKSIQKLFKKTYHLYHLQSLLGGISDIIFILTNYRKISTQRFLKITWSADPSAKKSIESYA